MATASSPDFALPPLIAAPRHILFFVAMEREAAPIAEALGLARAGDAFIGHVAHAEVTLVTPGIDATAQADRIGPVHASIALTRFLREVRGPIDLVVNAGTAGGFEAQGQRIADIVLARDTLFHDARVAIDGFDRVARAHTRLSAAETALEAAAAAIDARVGLVSTGASLDATADELAAFARTGALAKEMELAALAVACRLHEVPLVALKGITDLVDHHEPTEAAFRRNLARTAARVAAASGPWIETLCASARGTARGSVRPNG
jgi:nucleoside phosphorylase